MFAIFDAGPVKCRKYEHVNLLISGAQRVRAIGILLIGLGVITLVGPPASGAESPIKPVLIFMQPADAIEPVGRLTFDANPLTLRGQITPGVSPATESTKLGPPGQENAEITFRPLLAISQPDGGYHVLGSRSEESPEQPKNFRWQLYRARTPDGYHFTELKEVYRNPKGPWLIEAAMLQQATTGRFFFYQWSRSDQPDQGHALWGFVSDDGEKWRPLSDKPVYHDHDAFGMMWDGRANRFLAGQVTYQSWKKPYADNMGSSTRRVLHMRVSQDGLRWDAVNHANNNDLITPDNEDSSDLEFYRMQPFAYGDRYVAMADLYAASPLMRDKHGPHLTCEWWVSADGINWQRPWRTVAAQGDAPYPIKMTPMWFGREMLFWLTGQVWGLPEYRIAAIGSRSNAEFSSAAFAMPDKTLLLNASVPTGHGLFNQAYVQVELRDKRNKVIPGYERGKCLLQRVDDTRIPLRWGDKTGTVLGGQKVSLRFYLRGAHIYALGIER